MNQPCTGPRKHSESTSPSQNVRRSARFCLSTVVGVDSTIIVAVQATPDHVLDVNALLNAELSEDGDTHTASTSLDWSSLALYTNAPKPALV